MIKSKRAMFFVWLIAFVLSVFLLLIIPDHYNTSLFIVMAFDGVAFVSQLFLWRSLLKKAEAAEDTFFNAPVLTVSLIYLLIQFLLSVIKGIAIDAISAKTTLIINGLVLSIAWIIITLLLETKNHAQRVDSRQKDHHVDFG